jgi:hypothetical protein
MVAISPARRSGVCGPALDDGLAEGVGSGSAGPTSERRIAVTADATMIAMAITTPTAVAAIR